MKVYREAPILCGMKGFLLTLCLISSLWGDLKRPNLLFIVTDQERHYMHWPKGWAEKHLPAMQRLLKHGLSFERAYTSSCMCAPARAALMTSNYSPVNKVLRTVMPLPRKQELINLASFLDREGGYEVVWKGKWGLSDEPDMKSMRRKYGIYRWDPPDVGNADFSQYAKTPKWALTTLGGGTADQDARTIKEALEYLDGYEAGNKRRPFCLFVSLVNPHDVWVYPEAAKSAGYQVEDFEHLGVELPENYRDDLKTKPKVQARYREALQKVSPLKDEMEEKRYVNFYAYLHTLSDRHIGTLLDKLEAHKLIANTLIVRTADHGEMGLSHGLREKAYTAYEEMIHIPFIISNPTLFAKKEATQALYSHIDLVPTVADLIGKSIFHLDFEGVSQKPVIMGKKDEVREDAVFAFDDVSLLPEETPSSHIRALRHANWTYAVYFSPPGKDFEYELYDNKKDPGQLHNLLGEPSAYIYYPLARILHKRLSENMTKSKALPQSYSWPVADSLFR